MSKSCYQKGCLKTPAFSCECTPSTSFCKKHMGDHMLIKKPHNLIPLLILLEEPDEILLKQKTSKIPDFCSSLYKKTLQFSKNLINLIISSTNHLIQEIQKIESTSSRIKMCIFKSLPINIEDLKFIKDLNIENDFSKYFESSHLENLIKNMIENFIEDEKLKIFSEKGQNDLIIFSRFKEFDKIFTFDMETHKFHFKLLKLDNIGMIGSAVQIGKNEFLTASTNEKQFNKPSSSSTPQVSIQKINLESSKVEILFKVNKVPGGGMVFYNQSLYLFTGSQDSFRFDLESNQCTRLTDFPLACEMVSASIFNKNIYATGYSLKKIYIYESDKNRYLSKIYFNKETHRYLFENWLVSLSDSLYEIDENDTLIKRQDIFYNFKSLLVYSGFRKDKFIYFITEGENVFRINTVEKSLSLVQVS